MAIHHSLGELKQLININQPGFQLKNPDMKYHLATELLESRDTKEYRTNRAPPSAPWRLPPLSNTMEMRMATSLDVKQLASRAVATSATSARVRAWPSGPVALHKIIILRVLDYI